MISKNFITEMLARYMYLFLLLLLVYLVLLFSIVLLYSLQTVFIYYPKRIAENINLIPTKIFKEEPYLDIFDVLSIAQKEPVRFYFYQELKRIIDISEKTAKQLNTCPFSHILFEEDFLGTFSIGSNKILIIDLFLIRHLDNREISALFMHEYSHHKRGMKISYTFCQRCRLIAKFWSALYKNYPNFFVYDIIYFLTMGLHRVIFDKEKVREILSDNFETNIREIKKFCDKTPRLFRHEFHKAEFFADKIAKANMSCDHFVIALIKASTLQFVGHRIEQWDSFEDFYEEYCRWTQKDTDSHPSLKSRILKINGSYDDKIERVLVLDIYNQLKEEYLSKYRPQKQENKDYINYYYEGCKGLSNRDLEKAINDFTKAIESKNDDGAAYLFRGISYRYKNELNKAIDDFANFVEIENNKYIGYYHRGEVYLKKGDLEKAINDFTKAIEIEDDSTITYSMRGIAYLLSKRWNEAIKDFSKVINLEHKPTYIAYQLRGRAYINTRRWNEAVRDFSKVIRIEPTCAEAYQLRGVVYYLKHLDKNIYFNNNLNRAIRDLNKAIKISPGFSEAYYYRGLVYKEKGNWKKAKHDFEMQSLTKSQTQSNEATKATLDKYDKLLQKL